MATVARDANALGFDFSKPIWYRLSARIWNRIVSARATIFAFLVGVVAWEIAGRTLRYNFLPPFSNVVRTCFNMVVGGEILGYLSASVLGLFTGYGLAVVLGVLLGLLMGRYRKIEYLFDLYINVFLATPKIVFIPVLFALFGVNRSVQIVVVFLSAFFIIVINTMSAIRSVDATYVEMARSFGASERQLFLKIFLPGAMPLTMAGLRLGMGRAVRGMINGEMFITVFGLGALLRTYGSRFDAEKVFAVLLIVIMVALACSFVVQTVEQRVVRMMESRE